MCTLLEIDTYLTLKDNGRTIEVSANENQLRHFSSGSMKQ